MGILLLKDELSHSFTISWLFERKSREVWSLGVHRTKITKFAWLIGFRFRNNTYCHLLSALWKFQQILLSLYSQCWRFPHQKSSPLLFGIKATQSQEVGTYVIIRVLGRWSVLEVRMSNSTEKQLLQEIQEKKIIIMFHFPITQGAPQTRALILH